MWVAKRFITFLNSRKEKLIVVINICNKHDLMYRKLRQRWMLAGTLQNINVRRSEITKNGMFAVFFKSVSNTIFGTVHVTLPLRWLMMIFGENTAEWIRPQSVLKATRPSSPVHRCIFWIPFLCRLVSLTYLRAQKYYWSNGLRQDCGWIFMIMTFDTLFTFLSISHARECQS